MNVERVNELWSDRGRELHLFGPVDVKGRWPVIASLVWGILEWRVLEGV